jgi:hypothetical protein
MPGHGHAELVPEVDEAVSGKKVLHITAAAIELGID